MADSQLRDRYLVALMERVREDKYPSIAQMDLVESLLPVREMDTYLDILLEKIEADRFPSISMLNRVQRLVAQLPQAG
jgi:hypothetical protein